MWWLIAVLVAAVAVWMILVFNRLVLMRNQVRNAWSQIDVQLKRRHDLIPNLVSAVRGYMEHERNILENVTRAREQAIATSNDVAARIPAELSLTTAIRGFFARVENYPELKASQNMLALQEELSSTENRIGFARQFYNDSVTEYNTAIARFPANLAAPTLGFALQPFFEAESPARVAPVVRFSNAS